MRECLLFSRAHFSFEKTVAAAHPLRRLLGFARPYRRDAALGALFSVLNKVFDVLPELLIGVAVDVVVNQKASFLATQLGIVDPTRQLYLLVLLTVVVWVCESLFEYLYALRWRGPTEHFSSVAAQIGDDRLLERALRAAASI